jgi:hypothetical protein
MKKVERKKEVMLSHYTLWYDRDKSPDLAGLLVRVPLIPAIEQTAFLLHRIITRKKAQVKFHPEELLLWIMQLNGDTQRRATRFVTEQNPFNIQGFRLTNRRVCLSLMEAILTHSKGDATELTADHQNALFEALLILNLEYLATQEEMFEWDGAGNEETFLDIVLPAKMSSLGLTRLRDHQVALIKAAWFFEFCENDAEYKPYLQAFVDSLGLPSYREYIRSVIMPYLTFMTHEVSSSKFRIDLSNIEAIGFFAQFAVNGQTVAGDDFKTLRQFPVFQSDEQTFIFLFNNFFVDKLYQGFLFDLIKVVQPIFPALNYGKLKTDLGNRFSEHYLFYRTMGKCFGNFGQVRKTGEELKIILKDGEPDFYIRDGRKVFLFEFKDVQLRADIKSSASADLIREELLEKLDESVKGRVKSQPKAVRQLFNSIVKICGGAYHRSGVDDIDSNQVMIYPILVHTDTALETEGVNYFLKEKLNQLIEDGGLPKFRIKDLVVVNIDMMLSIQDLFFKKRINLANCINEFVAYTHSHGPLNRMIPFDEFLKFYLMKKKESFLKAPDEFNRLVQSFAEAGR